MDDDTLDSLYDGWEEPPPALRDAPAAERRAAVATLAAATLDPGRRRELTDGGRDPATVDVDARFAEYDGSARDLLTGRDGAEASVPDEPGAPIRKARASMRAAVERELSAALPDAVRARFDDLAGLAADVAGSLDASEWRRHHREARRLFDRTEREGAAFARVREGYATRRALCARGQAVVAEPAAAWLDDPEVRRELTYGTEWLRYVADVRPVDVDAPADRYVVAAMDGRTAELTATLGSARPLLQVLANDALRAVVDRDPVSVAAHRSELRAGLTDDHPVARDAALDTATALAERDGEYVAPLSDTLVGLVDDPDARIRRRAATVLRRATAARPDAVADDADALAATAAADPSPGVRAAAGGVLAALTTDRPGVVVAGGVDALVGLLSVDAPAVATTAAAGLGRVARVEPDVAGTVADALADALDEEGVRAAAARGLDETARGAADAVAPHAGRLGSLTSARYDRATREAAALALSTLAAARPGAVALAVPDALEAAAFEPTPALRTAVAETLETVTDDPAAALSGDLPARLAERLDHDSAFVRRRALAALAALAEDRPSAVAGHAIPVAGRLVADEEAEAAADLLVGLAEHAPEQVDRALRAVDGEVDPERRRRIAGALPDGSDAADEPPEGGLWTAASRLLGG